MSERRLVIIPTYKEKENIERMIRKVLALETGETGETGPSTSSGSGEVGKTGDKTGDYHLLVVDDGSPDGTAQIVKSLIAEYPGRLFILERSGKLGLGTAYLTGFKWGLARSYEYFFEMDADFSHNPDDLNRLYEACVSDGADVSVGSRYVWGGSVTNWSLDRRVLSSWASYYVRLITGMRIKDPTAGFVCYRRKVLETLNLDKIRFIGYAFQIEMKYKSKLAGFRIQEIPITFTDRIAGISKMSGGIIHEAIFGVLRLKWDSFWHT
ncbi:MAG TPA: polyprenol monophosphomannose synthase [Saprospiraceae bacterium]|nr:polyprenol monophosphomannose synthase [Saprospiraceae bacterium]